MRPTRPQKLISWVLSIQDSLPVARLQRGTLLRVIVKPQATFDESGNAHIQRWQVVFHVEADEAHLQPCLERS